MDKITALWPMSISVSNYSRFFKEIRVDSGDAFNPTTIFHEYGHHVLTTKAESPSPDYNNGICDPDPDNGDFGHCSFRPEKGVVSWTEGWPTFLAVTIFAQHVAEDGAATVGRGFGCRWRRAAAHWGTTAWSRGCAAAASRR